MTSLPIDARIPELLASLGKHRCLVLVAPPGAGKTTRVPTAIVKGGVLAAEHPGAGLAPAPTGRGAGLGGADRRGE